MLNYEEFKSQVETDFNKLYPEEEGYKVSVDTINKVNQDMDGIIIRHENDSNVTPTIYVNTMYEEYCNGKAYETVLESYNKIIKEHQTTKDKIIAPGLHSIKDNAVFQVINTEQNKELLKTVPHREYLDLSIIYRWMVNLDKEGMASSIINNNLANAVGLTEAELFEAASKNTINMFPVVIKPMNEIMIEIAVNSGMPMEIAELMTEEVGKDDVMYVITNDKGINGAASMLYTDEVHKLADMVGSDMYILPSSIHEIIAVPASMGEPYELAQMVNEVNMTQVDLQDRLSNQVYFYDRDSRVLTLATDTPNKRLDNEVENEHKMTPAEKMQRMGKGR